MAPNKAIALYIVSPVCMDGYITTAPPDGVYKRFVWKSLRVTSRIGVIGVIGVFGGPYGFALDIEIAHTFH
jgi:hypothetical protein